MTSRLSRLARSRRSHRHRGDGDSLVHVTGQMPVRAPRYAITNARIVTAAGAAIEKGTARDARRRDRGCRRRRWPRRRMRWSSTAPGWSSIRASSTCPTARSSKAGDCCAPARLARHPRRRRGRGRGGRGAPPDDITWADQEREARARFLHPDVEASKIVEIDGDDLRRLAAAGITSALAVPRAGHHPGTERAREPHGAPRPERDQRPRDLPPRHGRRAIGVAQHVVFATGRGGGGADGGGGGGGYPGALLGVIAFARQSFLDAQWQKEARAFAERHKDARGRRLRARARRARAGTRSQMPVAFEASEEREIVRALSFAKEFNLDPDHRWRRRGRQRDRGSQGREGAGDRLDELPGRWRRRGRGAAAAAAAVRRDTPIRVTRMRQNAAKVPAALEKAGHSLRVHAGGLQNPATSCATWRGRSRKAG